MAIWRRVLAIAVICMATSHVTAENTYMFVLPRTIRPGMPLSVRGTILKANVAPVSVTASLKRIQEKPNDIPTVVTETSQMFTGSEELRLDVMVPQDLGSGTYEIHIEGKGGVSFKNSHSIFYEPKSTSIFIQTDKAIYKPGQTVHFRILAVNPDLKVVKGTMDIDLYDPSGNKITQWKGVEDPSGVFEGQQIMSDQPILGDWKITVVMNKMKDEKTFTVDEYGDRDLFHSFISVDADEHAGSRTIAFICAKADVLPKFEVTVDLPSFGLTTDKIFKGSITAKYTFGKPVKGKVNLRIKSKYSNNIWRNGQMLNAPVIEKTFPIEGKASFEVTMKELTELDSSLDSSYLTVEVNVTETLTGITQSGSGEVQFFDGPIKMEFPESLPKVFKPGMIYKAFLKVSQRDGLPPVNPQGKVLVTITYFTPRPKRITERFFEPFRRRRWIIWPPSDDKKKLPPLLLDIPKDGVISFPLDIPVNVKRVSMQANYDKASAYLSLQKSHSPSNSYIQVRLLDNDLTAGDTANFEIKATENPNKLQYQILSKGNIIRSGTKSFSQGQQMQVPLDSSMAPKAKLTVYYIRPNGEIVADGINFNVKGIFRNKVSVKFDKLTAQPQDSLTLQLTADPGSKVNVLAVDKSVLLLKSGNDITPDEVNKELQSYDSSTGGKDEPVPFWLWRWPMPSGGKDASEVFDKAGLTVITDANLYKYTELE